MCLEQRGNSCVKSCSEVKMKTKDFGNMEAAGDLEESVLRSNILLKYWSSFKSEKVEKICITSKL